MFGNAYLKPNTKISTNERAQLYWLNSSCIDWGDTEKKLDKLTLSKTGSQDLGRLSIKYHFNDGTKTNYQLKELIPFSDLTNNTGNWFRGASRIDALYKILFNNESLLDAKNINLEFVRKFLVSGNYDPTKNIDSFGTLQDVEKEDIENQLRGNKAVLPIKSQVDIKRFVENLADLQLDETYVNDLLVIGDMYGIPKELLGVLAEGSTYENQDRALSRHITYSETPKGMDLIEGLCNHFDKNPMDYHMTWEHLPTMQRDEKTVAEVNQINVRTFRELINLGADITQAQEFLGLEEITIDYENRPNQQTEGGQGREDGENNTEE